MPAARHQAGLGGGGELLLPSQPVPGPAGRVLPRQPGLRQAAVTLQRGPVVHRAGPRGHQHQPLEHHLGHPGPLGPGTGHLRLGRRAHQLSERPHVRAPRGGPHGALLARLPLPRQGHPQVPRRHLAGPAHERRLRPAHRRAHPWLPAGRRREDEQDARQHAGPVRGHRGARRRAVPLLPHARGHAGAGRRREPRGPAGALQQRARQRAGQPAQPHGEHGRQVPGRGNPSSWT